RAMAQRLGPWLIWVCPQKPHCNVRDDSHEGAMMKRAARGARCLAAVFLSYASEDRDTAQRIAEGLHARGVSVWWDRDLYAGSDFAAEIQSELEMSSVIVVLWSAASVVSPWVRDEAAFARDKKHLIPLRIDGTEPPLGFRQLHTLELGRWNGDGEAPAFVSLSDSVRHALGSPVSPRAQLVPTKPKAKRHRIVAAGRGAHHRR